jgi:nucleoside-diphosphate-sugar epimerase
VVHAAVDYKSPDRGMLDRQFTETLLSACNRGVQPKTFIYTSGVWVYGNTNHKLVDETTPLNPAGLVTWRSAVEQMVTRASGIKGIVLRPGCVYGRQGGMTGDWFKQAYLEKSLRIIGDGTNHWAMVNVDDLADAYVLTAEKGEAGEVYNLVDFSRSNISEMFYAAAKAAGYSGKIGFIPLNQATQSLGDYAECLALDQHIDGRKATRLLGWQPSHTGFVDEVETYFQSWKAAAGLS